MSINLMELGNFVETIRPDVMSTDTPPPPPAGNYQIVLAAAEKIKFPEKHPQLPGKEAFLIDPATGNLLHDEKGFLTYFFMKDDVAQKRPYMQLVLQPHILLPNPDGGDPRQYPLERVYASCMVSRGVQTSMVDTLLRSITGKAGVGMKDSDKVVQLYALVVNGQAKANAHCDWEARYVDGIKEEGEAYAEYPLGTWDKKRLSTINNFPKDKEGHPLPVDIDGEGVPVRTRLVVKKWLPAPVSA